jgi:hypothetical protein
MDGKQLVRAFSKRLFITFKMERTNSSGWDSL